MQKILNSLLGICSSFQYTLHDLPGISTLVIMESNHINYVEFKAHNLNQTKKFYQGLFGWEFTDYGPTYTAFENSGLTGGFEQTDEAIINGALVVLYHNNLEAIQEDIIHAGGGIAREIFSFPGGRRFHFTDPNGNELAIWSDK